MFDVYVPNLPNTDNPVLEEQEEYIDIYSWDFKEAWLIVWHSLGCQLAMNFLYENNIENSTVILVAPTYPWLASELWKEILGETYDTIEKYYDFQLDFDKLNKQNNKIIVFLSDNDPYINMESAKKYYKNIDNIKFIEFKNKWHFNKTSWVLELEEILEYLEK